MEVRLKIPSTCLDPCFVSGLLLSLLHVCCQTTRRLCAQLCTEYEMESWSREGMVHTGLRQGEELSLPWTAWDARGSNGKIADH